MPEIETHDFPVKNFDRISFRALGNVKIIQGEEEGLTVIGEPSALEHVKISVEGNELQVKLFTWYDFLFIPRSANYVIKVKNLHAVEISGSAEIESQELLSSDMKLAISGSGQIKVGNLEASNLRMSITGAAKIEVDSLTSNQIDVSASGSGKFALVGNAQSLNVRTSGSAEVKAFHLYTQDVNVSVSGSGKYEVYASSNLHVSVSGSASVAYHGDPHVTQSISGSASIYKAD